MAIAKANRHSYVLSSDTETVGTIQSFVSRTAREELLDASVYWLQN
ncbi:MAG TPA: hypothetical protein V6D37_14055 [Candidatus Sericytochromatia bacterium]